MPAKRFIAAFAPDGVAQFFQRSPRADGENQVAAIAARFVSVAVSTSRAFGFSDPRNDNAGAMPGIFPNEHIFRIWIFHDEGMHALRPLRHRIFCPAAKLLPLLFPGLARKANFKNSSVTDDPENAAGIRHGVGERGQARVVGTFSAEAN